MTCLGDVVAALVDGELEHAARERAQRHLAHCAACRAEVDGQRRLKARLGRAQADPEPPDALTARLLALRLPADVAAHRPPPPARPRPVRAGRARPVAPDAVTGPARAARPGPARRQGRSRVRRGATLGSAVVVLGLGAALALGGPQAAAPTTPVAPGSDAFVVEFVSTSTGSVGGGR